MPELDPPFSKRLAQFVAFCSVLAVAFGLWTLAGWMLHSQSVKSILPGQAAVKANTAICFILLGFSLWFLRKEQPPAASGWKLAAKTAAGIASAVGLLSLLEFLWGWDFGIDQLLFTAGPEDIPGSARPGLISPIAALSFLCLGCVLLLQDVKTKIGRWVAQVLPCGVAIGSMFGVLDFVLDPHTTHTFTSPVTASVLFLFSFGLMFARSRWGLGALVGSATFGGTLTRRLLPAAILVPLACGWLRWKGEVSGLFSEWTGVAMMTVLSIVLLASLTGWTGFVVDRSDRERRQRDETIARLASIVTSSNDAIIGKTLNGIVTSWNPGAEVIYGYSAAEIIGQSISITVPPDRREELATIMERIRQGDRISHYETIRVRKDGKVINVSLSVSPVKDQAGQAVGASTVARDVTERKRAEDELRKASLYTRSLIEASLDPLVTISKDGKIMDVNRATELATGIDRQKLIGSDFSDYFSDPEKARQGYQRVFAEETVRDYPLAIRHTSGRVIDVLYNASVFKDEAGEVGGAFAAARDVTERNRVEEELRLSRERLALAQKAGHSGTFEWDIQNNVNRWSPEIEELYGIAPGEFAGTYQDWEPLLLPEDLPSASADIQEALKTGEFASEWRIRRRNDGEIRWLTARAKVTFDETGKPVSMIGLNMDITERRQAEEQLRKASLYTRSLIEASLDPLVTISRDGKITDVNEATENATGVSRRRLIGSDFSNYFTEPDNARRGYERVFAEGAVRDYPLAIRHTSGGVMAVLYNASVFKNAAGQIEGVFAAARDVTQRRLAEEALRESERQVSLRNRIAQICLSIADDEMYSEVLKVVLEVTQSKYGVFGYIDDLGGLVVPTMTRTVWQQCQVPEKTFVFPREQWGDSIWPTAIRRKQVLHSNQASDRTPAGHVRITRNISLPILHRGEAIGLLQVANKDGDYTAKDIELMDTIANYLAPVLNARLERDRQEKSRQQAEEQVRRLNDELEQRVIQRTVQLEAANKELEAFTYSVSHDLRAPLRHISGFSKILTEEYGSTLAPEAQRHLQRIQEGTRRMGLLVDDLLNLGRVGRHELRLQVTGLNSVANEVIAELKTECEGRQVEWKIDSLPYVECDPALMKQVFQNLLSNAVKFTQPRSPAIIEVGRLDQEGRAVVFVRDNGVGFNMKYADKLFGVFQRLHRPEDFEGTGVGLATVQRIIQKHGGHIWAEAEVDKGATFYFTLGASEKVEVKAKAAKIGEQA